ncbi:unnamed protein product [Camellia sinensis]
MGSVLPDNGFEKDSKYQQAIRRMDILSTRASQSTKLQDRLELEKPIVSDADLNSKVTKNVDNIPPALSENHQKQKLGRKAIENEELVKYMSNLPSYLEKGKNLKEKALNVGVLDWRRLEKWQYTHKPNSSHSSRCSPSSSNTSSFFSTDGSSTRSSRAHSCSPARERTHRLTLQFHLNASSPKEDCSKGVKTVVENVGKFQDLKASSSNNPLKGQKSIFRMYQSFSKNQSEIKLKECKMKDAEPRIVPKIETSTYLNSYEAASWSKGKEKTQDGESTSGVKDLREPCCDIHHNYHERCKEAASRRSFSEGSFRKELYNVDPHSDIPHSCPLPREDDNIKDSLQIKQPSSVDSKSIKFSSEPSEPSRCLSISPSRVKNVEEKKSKVMPRNSIAIKSSEGSDLKKSTVEASKSRNSSPTRRFSIGLGRIGRTFSSKDSSEHVTFKCGSEKAVASSCLEDSSRDKPSGTNRSSSPLKRLLDPLLKPKAANSHHFAESANGQVESSTVHSAKVKLDLTSCKTVNVDDSHHKKKHGSSTVQALLQITIKNELPLFTFAIDNNSDILAATMRKECSSGKDDNCWIYTIVTVHEVKKKNGWINQGGKGKNHGYVPNVVAQMTVSVPRISSLVRDDSVDELSIGEFVLFAQADQHASELEPNDELAAIIVKFPKETAKVGSFVRSQDLLSATVILPGGVHGLPSKGEPSRLIERWKSGGSCDCGGWDLGCRLRVLANQTKLSRRSSSSKTHHTADRFELFSDHEEVLDDRPIFSLSPFKDRIFSVEFNSSLSYLQAFSVCIAVLNSGKPYEVPELNKLFEDNLSEEAPFVVVNDGIKSSNQVQPEVPASHASYLPPILPVGRV